MIEIHPSNIGNSITINIIITTGTTNSLSNTNTSTSVL